MKIIGLFNGHSKQIVTESKILVCSLGPGFLEAAGADHEVFSKFYRRVDTAIFSRVEDLKNAIRNGYDVVHLFCHLTPDGLMTGTTSATLLGTELIEQCCQQNVKLLWIANENKSEDYVKGFKAAGRPLNLVMTIKRNGPKFIFFLDRLFSQVSRGQTLPKAWAALVPQAEGPWHLELPSCIFFAGRPEAKLLS